MFPITFKGATYNLPLHIRVIPDYPAAAPVVFLVPTPDMAVVRNHRNVDQTGRCYFPYLSSWSALNSNLSGVVDVMTSSFSEVPPLYSKPKVSNLSLLSPKLHLISSSILNFSFPLS